MSCSSSIHHSMISSRRHRNRNNNKQGKICVICFYCIILLLLIQIRTFVYCFDNISSWSGIITTRTNNRQFPLGNSNKVSVIGNWIDMISSTKRQYPIIRMYQSKPLIHNNNIGYNNNEHDIISDKQSKLGTYVVTTCTNQQWELKNLLDIYFKCITTITLCWFSINHIILPPLIVNAAPPIAVIAEELGYFPIRSPSTGEVIYVPKRIQRQSTDQAIELAKYIQKQQNIYMVGTYWCPHTSRQKELFGSEAFALIQYIECSPNGYRGNPTLCATEQVDGYPTWIIKNRFGITSKRIPGEHSLAELATLTGYKGKFDPAIEELSNPPPLPGSACK